MSLDINTNKFTLCTLPTQCGKTFITIERIKDEINNDEKDGKSIHIVFTMNTLLNNVQFSKRLKAIEDKFKTKGKKKDIQSVVVFSSKYEGEYKHVKNLETLQGICLDKDTCPKVIVMCSNKKRFEDGFDFVKVLERNNTNFERVFIYYDELHKYIDQKNIRKNISIIEAYNITSSIIALSATPDKIWLKNDNFWSNIKIINLEKYNDNNYIGIDDCNYIYEDKYFEKYVKPSCREYEKLDNYTIGYINNILSKNSNIISSNNRIFIPAHVRRKGHNKVRDMVFKINKECVVVVLNGFEKSLTYYMKKKKFSEDLKSSNEEVSDSIYNLLNNKNLLDRPLVITGFLCVGMGQTLTSENLGSFNYAIFSHLDLSNDDIYQLFGRITGRMKTWKSYKKTTVFCPTIIRNRCKIMEECAKNIYLECNDKNISQEEYRKPMYKNSKISKDALDNIRNRKQKGKNKKSDTNDKRHKIFSNQEEAIEWVKLNLNRKLRKRPNDNAPETLCKNNKNPTKEYIIERFWGINKKTQVRMIPTNNSKWVVYWRPSMLDD